MKIQGKASNSPFPWRIYIYEPKRKKIKAIAYEFTSSRKKKRIVHLYISPENKPRQPHLLPLASFLAHPTANPLWTPRAAGPSCMPGSRWSLAALREAASDKTLSHFNSCCQSSHHRHVRHGNDQLSLPLRGINKVFTKFSVRSYFSLWFFSDAVKSFFQIKWNAGFEKKKKNTWSNL